MSVGFIKRFLSLLNIVGVLALAGTAWGFMSHRGAMQEGWEMPDFVVPVRGFGQYTTKIDNCTMAMGVFPEPKEVTPEVVKPKTEEIETVLEKLGEIRSAVVVYEPYGDIVPALIFQFRSQPEWAKAPIVTIRVGEALQMRPHSDPQLRAWGELEPARYKFIGCVPDPEHRGWTYFKFDMNCDGDDIQKARWKGEREPKTLLQAATGDGHSGVMDVGSKGFIIRSASGSTAAAPKPGETQPTATQPADPVPVPPPSNGFDGSLFTDDAGTLAVTERGARHLKENYQRILEDVQTSTDIDSRTGRTRGIRIRRIKRGSLAGQFGIRDDDVIISVNDRKVTSQAQAVNVVKGELRKKPTPAYINVKILRLGRERTLRFDTRDPETKRKARDAFRNRR